MLTSPALERLLTQALAHRAAADTLLAIADRITEAGGALPSADEIDADVKAHRAERRRDAGCGPPD